MNAQRHAALCLLVAAIGLSVEQVVREPVPVEPLHLRGPWRRMGGGRGPTGRGAGRGRGYHRRGSGIQYLLDYADADTFVRATEAADVDPRPVANGGTTGGAWDFDGGWAGSGVARIRSDGAVLIEGARTNLITQSADASTWAKTGTGTETGSQAAPDGSTDAYRVEDTDAGAATTYTQTSGAVGIATHTYSVYVLQDSDETRFPEFEIFAGSATITGGAIRVQINTSTGATATRTGTPTSITVIDVGVWWRVLIVIEVTTGGSIGTRVRPAAGTTIGALNNAATGAVTAWGIQLEAGAFVSSPVRTSGAAATRNKDEMSFLEANVPAAIFTKGFEFDFWPAHDSGTDNMDGNLEYQIQSDDAASRNYVRLVGQNATAGRVDYRSTGAAQDTANINYVAGDKITVRVEHGVDMRVSINDVAETPVSLAGEPSWTAGDLLIGIDTSGSQGANSALSRLRAL